MIPEVSAIQSTSFPLGTGTMGTSYNVQHLETSVSAYDGDTILIGGLIQKKDDKVENKVPVMGDLPYVGWMFRFRTDVRSKTELVFIMTPHIVRNRMEAEQIMLEESRKIAWDLPEVTRIHGARNCEVFLPSETPQMPWGMPPPPQKVPNGRRALERRRGACPSPFRGRQRAHRWNRCRRTWRWRRLRGQAFCKSCLAHEVPGTRSSSACTWRRAERQRSVGPAALADADPGECPDVFHAAVGAAGKPAGGPGELRFAASLLSAARPELGIA